MFILFAMSCKDSQYVIKKTDKNFKYKYAQKWYAEKNWVQAIPVIENLIPSYKGSDTSELLYFMLAESYFYSKEYMVAAYHYKTFKDLYPKSYKAQVASFKIALCYKNDIPWIELEQTDTEKSIKYFQAFKSEYPMSPMVELANENLDKLNRILEKKALDAANLYYKTSNYRAAAVTFKNVLNEYPSIKEYEEILYKICNSYYKFAELSILTKQVERYEQTLNECQNFVNRFPNTKYKSDILSLANNSRLNILQSAYDNASSYYKIEERPFYFNESIGLYREFEPEIKELPTDLKEYESKCRVGVLNSYFSLYDITKNEQEKIQYYQKFMDYYHTNIDKFKNNTPELEKAESLYTKLLNKYKS